MFQSVARRRCHCPKISKRTFLSYLFGDALSSPSPTNQCANDEQREQQNQLYQDAATRVSLQHSHPSGPWNAISDAVQQHEETSKKHQDSAAVFRILDLACGPYGEPGTTLAHAMPNALVHCTDSCAQVLSQVPLYHEPQTTICKDGHVHEHQMDSSSPLPRPAPKNLTKSVADLSNLTAFESNSMDAITCCYGYGMVHDPVSALREAHRVLKPNGVLVTATWQHCRLHEIGRDVLATVRGHGRNPYDAEDDEAFLQPRIAPILAMELAGVGELEELLKMAGFASIISTICSYPFDLGKTRLDKMAMGTLFVRDQLLDESNRSSCVNENHRFTEEAFWMHIGKYATTESNNVMMLQDNRFKLAIATK